MTLGWFQVNICQNRPYQYMCGIAGIFSENFPKILPSLLDQYKRALLYRGRVEQGAWGEDRPIVLLHTRLPTIDAATGQQPMLDVTERYVIVLNGEIYNYKELRQNYLAEGAQFRTNGDTEVILEGYKLKGPDVCLDLNGMFSFAIYDRQEETLFMARDPLGKKPLYWTVHQDTFYFSSTLDLFLSIPDWDATLSHSSMALYSILGGFPEDKTIYKHAFSVPYASYIFITAPKKIPNPVRYYRLNFGKKLNLSRASLLDQYETLLEQAISIRLRADGPVQLAFSGGVDSGTISAICKKKLFTDVRCHTIDYDTPEDKSADVQGAKEVSRRLDLDWGFTQFDYHQDLLRNLPSSYANYDQPTNQLAIVYYQRLFRAMKPYGTVILSGNGCDELFTGYLGDEKQRQFDIFLGLIQFVQPVLSALDGWSTKKFSAYSDLMEKVWPYMAHSIPSAARNQLTDRLKSVVSDNKILGEAAEVVSRITQEIEESEIDNLLDLRMFLALTCSASEANYRVPDITGLTEQVEVRSPFLDREVVEFAARLPHKFKVGAVFNPLHNKFLPKAYYERYVGEDIAWSPKRGLGWNISWDKSMQINPTFHSAFDHAFDTLDSHSIDSTIFRSAWRKYLKTPIDLARYSSASGTVMNGFMLGSWFLRNL